MHNVQTGPVRPNKGGIVRSCRGFEPGGASPGSLRGRVETTSVTGAEKQRFRVGCTCNSHPTRSARNSLVTASRPVFVFAPDRTAPPRWWSHPTNSTHQHPSLPFRQPADSKRTMDDFNSETDSDYTSYWRDWVGTWTPPLLSALVLLA